MTLVDSMSLQELKWLNQCMNVYLNTNMCSKHNYKQNDRHVIHVNTYTVL